MNCVHHVFIGGGTVGLGFATAEAFGMVPAPLLALGTGALLVAAGSNATDLDNPRSFISNSIPSRVVRIVLAVLAIPLFATLAALLTTHDFSNTWVQITGLVFGVNFLHWALIVLAASLGLMLLCWLLYKSLYHRGLLHSIIFAIGVTGLYV